VSRYLSPAVCFTIRNMRTRLCSDSRIGIALDMRCSTHRDFRDRQIGLHFFGLLYLLESAPEAARLRADWEEPIDWESKYFVILRKSFFLYLDVQQYDCLLELISAMQEI
jgi:hypothetical protein